MGSDKTNSLCFHPMEVRSGSDASAMWGPEQRRYWTVWTLLATLCVTGTKSRFINPSPPFSLTHSLSISLCLSLFNLEKNYPPSFMTWVWWVFLIFYNTSPIACRSIIISKVKDVLDQKRTKNIKFWNNCRNTDLTLCIDCAEVSTNAQFTKICTYL